jgi:predicted nucleic acid-binding protein
MDAKRIQWYDEMPEGVVRGGLSRASEANVGGWDGYYAQVAIDEGVDTVVTIDDDFERFDAFDAEVILSPEEFSELNRFLEN